MVADGIEGAPEESLLDTIAIEEPYPAFSVDDAIGGYMVLRGFTDS